MPFIQYVGPYDRFSCPRWGIGDHPAAEPVEISDEAAQDLLSQPANYRAAKAPRRAAASTAQEG